MTVSISILLPSTGLSAREAFGAWLTASVGVFHNGRRRPGAWFAAFARDRRSDDRENLLSVLNPPENDGSAAWERECVVRTRGGDSTAFGRLVEHYAPRIYSHLYRIVGSREEAEDLAQETFLRVFRYLDRYDTSRPFKTWLYTIATNTAFNALRSRRRRGQPVALDDGLSVAGPASQEPGRKVERNERLDIVARAVGRLPPRSAALVQLYYREDLSMREAAEVVGMTEGAAKVALLRARRTLRQWLVEEDTV